MWAAAVGGSVFGFEVNLFVFSDRQVSGFSKRWVRIGDGWTNSAYEDSRMELTPTLGSVSGIALGSD